MTDAKKDIIVAARVYIEEVFRDDTSGHDAYHTFRVCRLAEEIARVEGADLFETQLTALLHDLDDRKLSPETHEEKLRAVGFMREQGIADELIDRVCRNISEVSFAGKDSVKPCTLVGQVVQDADRLDALGAIGIARMFAYGGHAGRPMYDPAVPPLLGMGREEYVNRPTTSFNHFYEKLFLLKDMMNTQAARQIAVQRQAYMEDYARRFLEEWGPLQE